MSLTNIRITGEHTVGGLIAQSHNTTVTNCYVQGTIRGEGDYVGGLIAVSYDNSVVSSHTNTSIGASKLTRETYMENWEIKYRYVTTYFSF